MEQMPPVRDLNIAADETEIYEGGNLTRVTIEDLIDNPVALRQLINDLNLEKKNNERGRKIIEQLQTEKSKYELLPVVNIIIAIGNLIGMLIVGLGTNLVTSQEPPQYAGWILGAGVILSVVTAMSPFVLSLIINDSSREK
jgi:hypothetical protein